MPTTPNFGLRFPISTDTPNVPRDIERLAVDLEALLGGLQTFTDTGTILMTTGSARKVAFSGASGKTITMPAASTGREVIFTNLSADMVTLSRAGADTFTPPTGGSTINSFTVPAKMTVRLFAVGTTWHIRQESKPLLNAFPTTPFDGMEALVQTAAMLTAGVPPYSVRYNAAVPDAHKWEVGDSHEWVAMGPNGIAFGNATYAAITNGATITLPFAGVWDIRVGGQGLRGDAVQSTGYLSYAIGATAATSDWGAIFHTAGNGHVNQADKTRRHTVAAAGTAVVHRAATNGGTSIDFYAGVLAAKPVRLS